MPDPHPPHPLPPGPDATSLRLGICSVTFRGLPAAEVARRVAEAGLEVVEWGADVHAPPDRPEALRSARAAADAHGIACCSYGSYFRCLPDELSGFAEIARGAVTLGAPRIRVWAGASGSAEAVEEDRARTIAIVREAALVARDHGLELGLEFHGGTLTDSVPSTVRLLEDLRAADVDNVSPYWQPPQDATDPEALAGLDVLADRVGAVHVFSWWPGNHRLPLSARAGLWTRAFARLTASPRPRDALLEFVPDDDPAVLAREAASLRRAAGLAPGRPEGVPDGRGRPHVTLQ
ncbi:sugar phosphate isomerase/epimerase family protein [Streptomyces zaomyceticus]|uniref:sugar phosphate isomerase/epimerase family protein n=1 Tax=Streptomyces zaomyceticus TaxID=68286 RepID=UPI0033AF58EE